MLLTYVEPGAGEGQPTCVARIGHHPPTAALTGSFPCFTAGRGQRTDKRRWPPCAQERNRPVSGNQLPLWLMRLLAAACFGSSAAAAKHSLPAVATACRLACMLDSVSDTLSRAHSSSACFSLIQPALPIPTLQWCTRRRRRLRWRLRWYRRSWRQPSGDHSSSVDVLAVAAQDCSHPFPS